MNYDLQIIDDPEVQSVDREVKWEPLKVTLH